MRTKPIGLWTGWLHKMCAGHPQHRVAERSLAEGVARAVGNFFGQARGSIAVVVVGALSATQGDDTHACCIARGRQAPPSQAVQEDAAPAAATAAA